MIAHLGEGDSQGMASIRSAFRQANQGYDVAWVSSAQRIAPAEENRIVFVQEQSAGQRTVAARAGGIDSEVGGGDIVLLPPMTELTSDSELDFLIFTIPRELPGDLPTFIRPDWDEKITDTPGGCATETGAYRRILLTWLPQNGPYICHALNAHRVRITDSFSHYHPIEGGFDEFYLVQMVQPNGRIIVSRHTDRIEEPETISAEFAAEMLETHHLNVGDLVYIPRGVVHRGVGGVLAQVITVPGFRPGAEIGVDHHLRAINEHLGLTGEAALPFNVEASATAVVR